MGNGRSDYRFKNEQPRFLTEPGLFVLYPPHGIIPRIPKTRFPERGTSREPVGRTPCHRYCRTRHPPCRVRLILYNAEGDARRGAQEGRGIDRGKKTGWFDTHPADADRIAARRRGTPRACLPRRCQRPCFLGISCAVPRGRGRTTARRWGRSSRSRPRWFPRTRCTPTRPGRSSRTRRCGGCPGPPDRRAADLRFRGARRSIRRRTCSPSAWWRPARG